jgi:hypothetical protein
MNIPSRMERLMHETTPEVDRRAKEIKTEEGDLENRIRVVMGTVEGRQFILDTVFVRCGVLQTSFVQKDSMASAFNEGRRNVGLETLAEIERFAPDLHLLARREELERRAKVNNSEKSTQEKTNG